MGVIQTIISRSGNYLSTIGVADVVDILIVAYLIYTLIQFVRKTQSFNLAKGLILFAGGLWLSEMFDLNMINFLLRKAAELGLVALVILFQPELRRLLEKAGSRFLSSGRDSVSSPVGDVISQVVLACSDMSSSRTGALIVFERNENLRDIAATGTLIDAEVSAELLKNIFYNKAPLHDGAVVISNGRIASAGCILPLTANANLSKELGMRHRAGIGISEQSDALVLIVSEETGSISCSVEGTLKRHLDEHRLSSLLREALLPEEAASDESLIKKLIVRLFGRKMTGKDETNDEKDS